MESTTQEKEWFVKMKPELDEISRIIKPKQLILSTDQPHISGERFLMMRNKMVLVGMHTPDNKKVIIKFSAHKEGRAEIRQEKIARDFLSTLNFSSEIILFPREILFEATSSYTLLVTEFIDQDKIFIAHSIEEQFFMLLKALEAQETFHATTFEHIKNIRNIFKIFKAQDYISEFISFKNTIKEKSGDAMLLQDLEKVEKLLKNNKLTIDTYCNYLTHTDLVPHNFRIHSGSLYLLDCSSVYFGNKYEGWARLLNYMVIHNPKLERILSDYVLKNRDVGDFQNLQLMRMYKLGYLLMYYVNALEKTTGNLKELTQKRIVFWYSVLKATLENKFVEPNIVEEYISKRDILRSEEEKSRQKEVGHT